MGLTEVCTLPLEAWYMDEDTTTDQRLPHHLNPPQYVSMEKLSDLGVLHWKLDANDCETNPELLKIRKERGYSYQDILDLAPEKVLNYTEKIKIFYEEHIHTDEEIRFCLDGSGYFDVRDFDDKWIRIWTRKGDMIVLPAGIYHRFTLDENNYIKVLRLFVGEPIWTPYNRPQEDHPIRMNYVIQFKDHGPAVLAQ